MRALFEQIERDGFEAIERAVTERQLENVGLDFKEKANARNGRLEKADRQTLAENLSAFANSAGGLLVFGVAASKDADGIDAASEIRHIAELAQFESEVTHAAGELLLPRHDGIQVLAVPDPRSPGTGCLAIWVERSERRPHQSQAAKDRRYYKRAGDSTFVMEHYDIEDAFRRLATPELTLESHVERGASMPGGDGRLDEHRLIFSLRNNSPVSAKFPYLHFTRLRGLAVSKLTVKTYPFRYHQQQGRLCFDGGADVIINPGQSVAIAPLALRVLTIGKDKYLAVGENFSVNDMELTRLESAEAVYHCDFGAEKCRMQSAVVRLSSDNIADLLHI